MNLWVKRIALGLTAALALFLFACLDEENVLGFRNQNQKFKVSFIELPVESSVLLFGSLRTSNYYNDQVRRLLVGSYEDPTFGNVTAEAYTQLLPSNVNRAKEAGAIYDSVTLYLNLDLYHYGSAITTLEEFSVHELEEDMTFRGGNDYYAVSQVQYSPTPLGVGNRIVNPAVFKEEREANSDTIITVTIPMNFAYGNELFNTWNATSKSFTDFELFSKQFKGLALVGTNNSKVVGISLSDSSRLTLHYHTATDTLGYNFYFRNVASASRIVVDRSSSQLSNLTVPYQEFTAPNPNKLYIQSGVPIVTKLDFSKFLEFSDTIENLVINSAELSISQIDEPGAFEPPNSLFLQILNEDNRLKKYKATQQDSVDLRLYSNSARTLTNGLQGLSTSGVSGDSIFSVISDFQDALAQMSYNTTTKKYSAPITLFLQELYIDETDETTGLIKSKFTDLVLYPGNPFASKSLNRVSFDKSNLKLKVYYTTPIINE